MRVGGRVYVCVCVWGGGYRFSYGIWNCSSGGVVFFVFYLSMCNKN